MRLGLHISDFSWPGGPGQTSTMLFDVGADGSTAGDLLARLRVLHEDGITLVYGRMTAEGYRRQLGVIAREVIPVIADW